MFRTGYDNVKELPQARATFGYDIGGARRTITLNKLE
jgi:hypothetical protein